MQKQMLYTFPNKLRNLAIIFMVIGFLGLTYGFLSAPSSIEESKVILAANHSNNHGDDHGESDMESHGVVTNHESTPTHKGEETHANTKSDNYEVQTHRNSHNANHDEHVFHQLANKPWAAFYVAAFFFFMISLGVLAFYAIQRASQAGWSPVLYRVMEGITAYLLPGGIIVLIILVLSSMHLNHLLF